MSQLAIGDEQLCWKNWVNCRDPQAGDILVKNIFRLFLIMYSESLLIYRKVLVVMILEV